MRYAEIPSDEEVVETLAGLGSSATAWELCKALTEKRHSHRDAQMAIQRAAERGKISVGRDLKLTARVLEAA